MKAIRSVIVKLLLAGLAFHAVSAAASIDLSTPQPVADPFAEEVRLWASTIVASGATPALAVAVIRPDYPDLLIGIGETVAGTGAAVTEHTVLRLASVSKGFAATLCAVLADAGFLNLNQSVLDLVPGVQLADPNAATALTLERLLSHQTGLPHHTGDMRLEANASLADLISALPKIRPACAVGGCYAYQNVLFNVASDVAFSAVGSFFQLELQKRLLLPLDMRDSSVGREALMSGASWARPHVHTARGWVAVDPKPTYYQLPAAAGVNASIHDVAKWIHAQLGKNPEVLSPEVLSTVQTQRVNTPGEMLGPQWRRDRVRAAGYALGWRVFDYAGQRLVYHAGAVQGYRAMVGMFPERGYGIAVLWNSNSGVPAGIFPRALDRELGLNGPDWLDLTRLQATAARVAKRIHARQLVAPKAEARSSKSRP